MMDNKLLHRDLQTSISNLKSAQLKKMLIYYEKTVGALTEKTFSSTKNLIQKKVQKIMNA